MTVSSASCRRCNFWSRIQRIIAHFRYQQENTTTQSLQLQYLRLLIVALVVFWYICSALLKISCTLIYLFAIISLSYIFPCCWGFVCFVVVVVVVFWGFLQCFAINDLSMTLGSFWTRWQRKSFLCCSLTHYPKAAPALVREDFSFHLGTQCQNDSCTLRKTSYHILKFPNCFWIAGPKTLFGCCTLFELTDFEEKLFLVFFRCTLWPLLTQGRCFQFSRSKVLHLHYEIKNQVREVKDKK